MRSVRGEIFYRKVQYGENVYFIERRWHYLDNGDQYHYIHVYKNSRDVRCLVHQWTWVKKQKEVVLL